MLHLYSMALFAVIAWNIAVILIAAAVAYLHHDAGIFFLPEFLPFRGRRSASRSSTDSLLHSFPSRAVQKLQFKHPVNRMPPLSISLQSCPQIWHFCMASVLGDSGDPDKTR